MTPTTTTGTTTWNNTSAWDPTYTVSSNNTADYRFTIPMSDKA